MDNPTPTESSPYQPVPRAALHPPAADLRTTIETVFRLAYPLARHPFHWTSERRPDGNYQVMFSTPAPGTDEGAVTWGFQSPAHELPPPGTGNVLSVYGPEGCNLLDEHDLLVALLRATLYAAADRATVRPVGSWNRVELAVHVMAERARLGTPHVTQAWPPLAQVPAPSIP